MCLTCRAFGHELSAAAPTELTIGNVVRRVLFCIREEHAHQLKYVDSHITHHNTPNILYSFAPFVLLPISYSKATTVKENVDVAPSANYNGGQHNPNLVKVSHHFGTNSFR